MPTYFFTATKDAHAQVTELFDFVWPAAAAMWNLRWQVAGYLRVVPSATVEQLKARFTEGADIHGANLRRSCVDHTWEEQQEAFARILLVNSVAIYEGWIDEVLNIIGKNTIALKKALQYPDSTADKRKGAAWAIAEISTRESSILRGSFYESLCKGPNCALSKLDALLLCFRFFKELRNCDMHGGGCPDQRLLDSYAHFSKVATPAHMGVSEVPIHSPVVFGTKATLSLRGVVGFSHVILKLITTLDAEFSRSELAETSFINKWKLTHPHPLSVSTDPTRRQARVAHSIVKAGFPKPASCEDLCQWLKTKRLIHN